MEILSFDEWRDQVNKLFLKHCVMTIEDAGGGRAPKGLRASVDSDPVRRVVCEKI